MEKRIALSLSCLALGALGIGCGGGGAPPPPGMSESIGSVGEAQISPTGQNPGVEVGDRNAVDIRNNTFLPKDVDVTEGGQIVWINSDPVPHTVTKTKGPGGDFDSGPIDPGRSFSQTFRQEGKVEYESRTGPKFRGTITIK